MNVQYYDLRMDTCANIQARIDKINLLITSLLDTAMKSVSRGDKIEYSIDTGQSKERVVFSSLESVTKAIENYERIKQMYQGQLHGNSFTNIDSKNLRFR